MARLPAGSDAPPGLGQTGPVANVADPEQVDLTHMSRKVKEVIRAAGLRDELTFTSFRARRLHGGPATPN